MLRYSQVAGAIQEHPRRWVVTGGAGFIGSHLVERLLELGQDVLVIDDFSTGSLENLAQVREAVGSELGAGLNVVEADVSERPELRELFEGATTVFHLAAVGSVPRSIAHPAVTHKANTHGTFKVLEAAKAAGVARVVYASSSSVYGDDPENPRKEDRLGRPLSPYAASKRSGELYLEAFATSMGLSTVSLRYFNVFGPRQNPEGGYAAVIPRWIMTVLGGGRCDICGDGLTTRDFCYVENVVRANLLASVADATAVDGRAFNVGCEDRTTLNELHAMIVELASEHTGVSGLPPRYVDFRPGDVRHSHASIQRAVEVLQYEPVVRIRAGLREVVRWYASVPATRDRPAREAHANQRLPSREPRAGPRDERVGTSTRPQEG